MKPLGIAIHSRLFQEFKIIPSKLSKETRFGSLEIL